MIKQYKYKDRIVSVTCDEDGAFEAKSATLCSTRAFTMRAAVADIEARIDAFLESGPSTIPEFMDALYSCFSSECELDPDKVAALLKSKGWFFS